MVNQVAAEGTVLLGREAGRTETNRPWCFTMWAMFSLVANLESATYRKSDRPRSATNPSQVAMWVVESSTFPSVVRQATGTAPSAVTVRMNTSCNRSGLWSFECPRLAAMVGLAPRVTPVAVA